MAYICQYLLCYAVTVGQRYITEDGLKKSSTNLIQKGNLLVATRVGIGKAGEGKERVDE